MRLCLFVFSICLCLILGAGHAPAKTKVVVGDIQATLASALMAAATARKKR